MHFLKHFGLWTYVVSFLDRHIFIFFFLLFLIVKFFFFFFGNYMDKCLVINLCSMMGMSILYGIIL
jgi:hypothetical protein